MSRYGELTVEQITMAISRALRRPLPPSEAVRSPSPDVGHGTKGAEHLARFAGWRADIPALRKLFPRLMNFDSWLAQGGAAMIERLLKYSDTMQ